MNNRTEEKLKDLSGMQKAVSELLQQAWERGYKYCEAEHEENIEDDHELCVGDVVSLKTLDDADHKAIIIGFTSVSNFQKVFVNVSGIGIMILPIEDVTFIGKHVDVLEFFNKAFIDISRGR